MPFEWNWNYGIANYFRYLTSTLELTIPSFRKASKHKAITDYQHIKILNIIARLENDKLNVGDLIRIRGIYSEFIPIFNISLLFPKFVPPRPGNITYLRSPLVAVPEFSLPLRLKPTMGFGLAGLFNKNCKGVYDMCIPIFYNKRLFKLQKEVTGYEVEIDAEVVNIPERWRKLFINHKFFKYTLKGQELYAGLLVHKLEKYKKIDKFFTDFWRLDYFPFESYDEDYYEIYQIESVKGWPRASKYMTNYLSLLQLEGFRQKQIRSFGILPKINLANSNIVRDKRKQLKDFYLYAYKQSQTSRIRSIPVSSAGHGAFDPSNFKKAVTVFHHDQVNPVLSQQLSFKDVK